MKHSIREHIIDPIRGKIVKVSTVNAELGSGITDKNGREIFEGDIVLFEDGTKHPVLFDDGEFIVDSNELIHNAAFCEVVGHVDD